MLLNLRPSEVLVLALLTGCAAVEKTPSPSPVPPPAVVSAPAPERVTPANIPAATSFKSEPAPTTTKVVAPAAPRQPVKTADHASVTAPTVVAVTPRAAPIPAAPTAPAMPVAAIQTLATAAATPIATQQSPPDVTPQTIIKPPEPSKPPEPTLDMTMLQSRLRQTPAIGVFTKLALKNQVDTLMQQFRTHYQSGQKTSVTTLRQPYDLLVLKVLTLVQDDDPPLAKMIAGSREAIWDILADPVKFKTAI